jgi:hypothetical protein
MTRSIAIALYVALQALALTDAFQGPAVVRTPASDRLSLSSPRSHKSLARGVVVVLGAITESAFVPPPVGDGSSSSDDAEEDDDEDEDVLEKVEQLGRGGAKVRLSHT